MKQKIIILLIIAFALGIRLIYVGSMSGKPINSMGDEPAYDSLAMNLVKGRGYVNADGSPNFRNPPLTAAFFATIYTIFGHSIMAVRAAHAFLGALTCFIIYLLGRDMLGEKVGLLSAAIAGVYPSFIFFTGKLLAETILLFFIAFSVYLLLKKGGSASMNSLLSGISFGLTGLIRPAVLPLPLAVLFVLTVFKKATLKETIKKTLIVIVGIIIVIAPWTIRNYYISKEFIVVNVQLGAALIGGYFYPKEGFGFQNEELLREISGEARSKIERDRLLVRYAVDNILKNPYKHIKLIPLKFLWFWEPFGGRDYGFRSSYNVIYGLVFLFFLFSLVGCRTIWRDVLPFYTAIVYFVLLSLALTGSRRYRMQIEPFMIILASYGLFWVKERWKKNRLISIALIIGLFANLTFLAFADNFKTFSKKIANFFGYYAFTDDK